MDWSQGRGRSRDSLALTGPAPKRLRLSAAGSGAGSRAGSGVALPHCLENISDARLRFPAYQIHQLLIQKTAEQLRTNCLLYFWNMRY